MEKNEAEGKHVVLQDKHYSDFQPSAVPIAPDGGIVPGYGMDQEGPPEPVQPERFICLRGPCRHFWHLISEFPSGNPENTWLGLTDPLTGAPVPKPRQHTYSCLVHPGMETELTEDTVFDCNLWDPVDPHDSIAIAREERRRLYQIRTTTPKENA